MDENASFGSSMWDFCGGNKGNDEYRGNLVILFARLYLAGQEKVDIFGTSAKFISTIDKEYLIPRVSHDLSAIKLIMSTGSTMTHESFRYVYRDVKTDVFYLRLLAVQIFWVASVPVMFVCPSLKVNFNLML